MHPNANFSPFIWPRLLHKIDLGVDFFETYSPVVQWTTIHLMLVLECILGLCSKQGDITCAFPHASLGKDEAVYIEMPQGFRQYDKNGKPKVLKLN
jgi:hypothetical protein